MARILLGVSGGIAAYKALELARLATKERHAVRVLMTPAAKRFVGPASFEGIVGAPVLIDEFDRDPARGAFPGDPVPEHDPIGHLEVVANADAYMIVAASAEWAGSPTRNGCSPSSRRSSRQRPARGTGCASSSAPAAPASRLTR